MLRKLYTDQVSPSAKKMMDFLKGRVVGQDRALDFLTRAAERSNSPLRDKKRPIGSFLFLGPSGVGKTETARALAKYLFEDEGALTYIDCTKFGEPHEVSKLKGSPPGYIGFLDPEEFNRGNYPLLSHWNVYKPHHLYLERIHQKELDVITEEWRELWELKEEIKIQKEKLQAVRQKEEELASDIALCKQRIRENGGAIEKPSAIQDARDELADVEWRFGEQRKFREKLEKELEKKEKEHKERGGKNLQALRAAERKGWFYDDERPSEELQAVVLFDEIEQSAGEMEDHLIEI